MQGTRDDHGRLKLSSRKLLVILKHLPDESEFKTHAQRNGNWTVDRLIAAKTHNAVAKWSASWFGSKGIEGDDTMWTPFETPLEQQERIDEDTFTDDERDDFYSMFDS